MPKSYPFTVFLAMMTCSYASGDPIGEKSRAANRRTMLATMMPPMMLRDERS